MPRHVRNFWLEANIDGKVIPIAAGPRGKDGGFTLTVQQRVFGEPVKVLTIQGSAELDGQLVLEIYPNQEQPFPDHPICLRSQR